ncbi:hypothetical protein ANCCAN_12646 [Ancylostoma caninum]|uniref:Uncharacterized protein n=1 Tax=Ancylostoma caninum TaxID=29170 RepID=A0A368GDP1_ANCCA|nr:hypothetical protein ANCCAN_12646 [Ancylostoma caninum]
MWCKWDLHELRTTNSAEAFHSKLRKLLNNRMHPPFEDLLELLQEISLAALGTLLYMEANRNTVRPLRRRDSRRRRKISQAMEDFKREMEGRRRIPAAIINQFCSKMFLYVTEKTI